MAWVVDSNILFDLALDDPAFRPASMEILRARRSRGLVVCPVTLVELAPSFDGHANSIEEFLDALSIESSEPWIQRDTAAACVAWARHISQRHKQRSSKRPIADVLIGAFAERFEGLLTRNPTDFRTLFPGLVIEQP